MADIDDYVGQIHCGDAIETLGQFPENSVHCVVCSPPYWGLRDYGVDGQIGLEDTLEEFVQSIVDVGHELRRVLRSDGSWWLNLGDTFSGGWGIRGKPDDHDDLHNDENYPDDPPARNATLPPKNKMLIPHRVAIALQEAGWIVRADCVWAKPNPMPHPVKDRLTETKEFVFHLTPKPNYWFDLDAIREPHKEDSLNRGAASFRTSGSQSHASPNENGHREGVTMDAEDALHPNGKNPGDVLEITVKPFPEAHSAVYPPELVETPVKASCPPRVCATCGTPYDRETETEYVNPGNRTTNGPKYVGRGHESPNFDKRLEARHYPGKWEQTCDCDTTETQPGIVLDPFAGAGTTCLVAKQLGRRFVGIDLNPEYVAMAQKRLGLDVHDPSLIRDEGQAGIAAFDGGENA